jgi:hypothetical protein
MKTIAKQRPDTAVGCQREPLFARRAGALGAVLLSLLWSRFAASDELGRLFFNPERRAALERQRELNLPQQQALGENDSLTIDGIVMRSNGKRTIWINGTAVSEDSPTIRFRANPARPGTARLAAGDEPPVTLTVGSTVSRNSGQVSSLLGNGSIRVQER